MGREDGTLLGRQGNGNRAARMGAKRSRGGGEAGPVRLEGGGASVAAADHSKGQDPSSYPAATCRYILHSKRARRLESDRHKRTAEKGASRLLRVSVT